MISYILHTNLLVVFWFSCLLLCIFSVYNNTAYAFTLSAYFYGLQY